MRARRQKRGGHRPALAWSPPAGRPGPGDSAPTRRPHPRRADRRPRPGQTRETRDLIKQLGRDRTVVLSSHILSEVEATCERVLIINEGRLVADGAPGKLAQRIGTGRKHEVELVVRGDADEVESALREVPGVDTLSSTPVEGGIVRVVASTRTPD